MKDKIPSFPESLTASMQRLLERNLALGLRFQAQALSLLGLSEVGSHEEKSAGQVNPGQYLLKKEEGDEKILEMLGITQGDTKIPVVSEIIIEQDHLSYVSISTFLNAHPEYESIIGLHGGFKSKEEHGGFKSMVLKVRKKGSLG